MKRIRRIILWTALAVIVLLLCLSIIGAFLGDQQATAMFNSFPLTVFWLLLFGLLIASLLLFKRLIRSLGLLAVHLGALLILAGAMYGSDYGHHLAAEFLGSNKVPSGYMRIFEGQAGNSILDDSGQTEIAKLPFSVGLRDFSIEYYDIEDPWRLIVESPQVDKEHQTVKWVQKHIDWAIGREVDIPFTPARLEVLQYLEHARATFADDAEPVLEITSADGSKTTLSAEVGQRTFLEGPHLGLEILQVFSNLRVQATAKGHQVIDVPGPPENPAVLVRIESADGKTTHQYVYALGQIHGQQNDAFKLRYVFAAPDGAVPDPASDTPAMEVLLKYADTQQRHWLIVGSGTSFAGLPLAELLNAPQHQGHEGHSHAEEAASLYLYQTRGPIRDYKSDLVILEEGKIVKSKVIEVNKPLHYGGYHFYQSSYDDKAEQYTILSVGSDSGLTFVYIGFALLAAGMFWLFWISPVGSYLSRRRSDAS